MEFQQAIQNLIKFADRVKELDREIMKSREYNRQLLVTASENGLIAFEKAKIIHEELVRIDCMKQEIEEAEKIIAESKAYLKEHLLPFEGQRIVFEYNSEHGKGRTCQVFLEEDEVRCI
jgi:hypothetical protein